MAGIPMTPFVAKTVFCLMAVAWYVIRFPYERRSGRARIARNSRDLRETILLTISLSGLGLIPFLYVATGFPALAARPFLPILAWLGVPVAVAALVMFRLTHKALGRNWSVSLQVKEDHRLVESGVYGRVRHPMYTAFWFWALAQALLLPNWVAGLSGLVGFGTLYAFRIGREERMMLETFGEEYRAYCARTARLFPWIY